MQIYAEAESRAKKLHHTIWRYNKRSDRCEEPKQCKLVCNCNGFSQVSVPQGTLISPNMLQPCTRMLLCRGATVYAASSAQPNIRRSLSNANLFAIAMASRRCVCRKAHLYLQICYGHAPECCSAEVPQYMRQAARSRIYAEIEASEPERNSENHCNTLRNFTLRGFNRRLSWFRCSGKE